MIISNSHIAPSKIHGLGLFASSPLKKGQEIFYKFDRCMMNHSDTPNTKRAGKTARSKIITIRTVLEGEELTEDYNKLPKKDRPDIIETEAMQFIRFLSNVSAIMNILEK